MAFDITSVLKNVPGTGTGEDQIEYIDLDLIDPDPENFYSLDGLDDLAANIELIGLQQPLRVRPGEGSHVIVVSGHRRRAACLMLRDGGNEKFNRVACIREKDEVSAAMRELRLIYANASTRVMSPAEMSKQAERVEMLLYQLKEEGVEFPGRMRDHVAQACKVSKSKLSRLHAIRKNMAPDLLSSCFDAGLMPESVAYELSRHEQDTQRWIVDTYKATHPKSGIDNMQEWWARDFGKCVKKMAELHCRQTAGGGECIHQREHIEHIWRRGYEGYEGCVNSREGSAPKCCADCDNLASCSVSCPRCEPKKKKLKADIQAQRRSERETKKADEANRKAQKELEESQAALYWARLGGALKDAGIDFWTLQDKIDRDHYHTGKMNRVLCSWRLSPNDIEALLDGKPAKNEECEIPTLTWERMDGDDVAAAQMLCEMADLLGVSIDYLMLRTDDPRTVEAVKADRDPEAENDLRISSPKWIKGEPDHDGRYLCKMLIGKDAKPHEQRMEWKAGGWYVYGDPADKFDMSVQCWWPLPPEV